MRKRRVLLFWSSGKDSAWALHLLRQERDVEIAGLLTTLDETTGRVPLHGTRGVLVDAQARAARLPLRIVPLPFPCPNEQYERRVRTAIREECRQGVSHVAFGDLWLRDIRDYRKRLLAGTGAEPLFPLWSTPADTPALARRMIGGGLRATVTGVDPERLPSDLVGRELDAAFLAGLPPDVDPCGERGEFHTFVRGGPMFEGHIGVRPAGTVEQPGLRVLDLRPDPPDGPPAAGPTPQPGGKG